MCTFKQIHYPSKSSNFIEGYQTTYCRIKNKIVQNIYMLSNDMNDILQQAMSLNFYYCTYFYITSTAAVVDNIIYLLHENG